MGYIYKIINKINQKIYIGKSKHAVEKSQQYFGSGILIVAAIKKYGKKNFSKKILEKDIQSDDILNEREIYWIRRFRSTNRDVGYNRTSGGDGGNTFPIDTKERINRIESMSGKNNPFYNKHHTQKTKNLISRKNRGRVMDENTKAKISETLTRKYKSGEIVKITTDNARKLSSERWKINPPMRDPKNKKRASIKMSSEENPSTKWWIFEKISGEKYERFSFRQTCKEFGLSYGSMRHRIGKENFSRTGWKVYERNK